MQLIAVARPPADALSQALDAAHALCRASAPEVTQTSGGLLSKMFKRQEKPAPAPDLTFVPLSSSAMFLRIARLGNVSSADAIAFADTMSVHAATWPTATLRFGDISVTEEPMPKVFAELAGDVDALFSIFRGFNDAAKLLGFFLDRRNFRPHVELGRIEGPGRGPVPADTELSGVGHAGAAWRLTELSLMRATYDGEEGYAEVAALPLSATDSPEGATR